MRWRRPHDGRCGYGSHWRSSAPPQWRWPDSGCSSTCAWATRSTSGCETRSPPRPTGSRPCRPLPSWRRYAPSAATSTPRRSRLRATSGPPRGSLPRPCSGPRRPTRRSTMPGPVTAKASSRCSTTTPQLTGNARPNARWRCCWYGARKTAISSSAPRERTRTRLSHNYATSCSSEDRSRSSSPEAWGTSSPERDCARSSGCGPGRPRSPTAARGSDSRCPAQTTSCAGWRSPSTPCSSGSTKDCSESGGSWPRPAMSCAHR